MQTFLLLFIFENELYDEWLYDTLAYEPTMMLLIGIWMSLTKKPMKPIIQKPMAVAIAIFWNSRRSGFVHLFTKRMESLANRRPGSQNLMT